MKLFVIAVTSGLSPVPSRLTTQSLYRKRSRGTRSPLREADESTRVSTCGSGLFRCSEEAPVSGGSGRTEFHAMRSLAPSAPLNALYSPLSPLSRLSHLLSPLHSPSMLSPSPSTFAALGLQASIASASCSEERQRGRESAVAVAGMGMGVGVSAASSAMCTMSSCEMPSHSERAPSSQAAHRLSFASIFSVPRPSTTAATNTSTTFSQTCATPIISTFAAPPNVPASASATSRCADANAYLRSAVAARSRRSIRQNSNDALLLSRAYPNAPYPQSAMSSLSASRAHSSERVWDEGNGAHSRDQSANAPAAAREREREKERERTRQGAEARRRQWLAAPKSNAAELERERERATREVNHSRPLSAAFTADRERDRHEMLV